jgi:aspartyl-tRNA(Asn)/glutamyl-tRNA(Gln) amidotransferase subunit A
LVLLVVENAEGTVADDALCWVPATELAAAIRAKRVSPVEVVEAVLARIARLNPRLRAYLTVTGDLALRQARAAEQAVMRGDPLGALHGVPVGVKDLSYTKGIRTTRGSLLYEHFVPDEDHPMVERLYDAGAIIVGKTNTPEFGWKGATDNRLGPPCLNPWDETKTPGGSSGGSAVAVATGMAPIATGSDGVCSIRTPASFCGIYGLKPQYGRIPSPTMGLDVAHLGPMARTVRDAALMLNALAGPHEGDRQSLPASGVDYVAACDGGTAGLRVAWSGDLGYLAVDPEVRRITEAAAKRLSDLGCTVEEVDPGFADPAHAIDVLFHGLIAGRNAHLTPDELALMDPGLAAVVEKYRDLPTSEVMAAQAEREALWQQTRRFFERYDLLLTPTVACPPFGLNRFGPEEIAGQPVQGWSWTAFTYPFNLTGQPAATVPCGWTQSGLPVGLHIVGRRYDEPTVLRASAAFEETFPWSDRIPSVV